MHTHSRPVGTSKLVLRNGRTHRYAAAAAGVCLALGFANKAAKALPAGRADDDLLRWRQDYAAGLARPDGWLSLVALQWLAEGDTTVGSAADNKLRLPHVPAHALTLHQHAGQVTLATGPISPCLRVDGKPAQPGALQADRTESPSTLTCNSVQMTVIERGDRLYLRVKDSASPLRTHFTGLHWFAPTANARVTARWIPYASPHTLRITNVLGQTSEDKIAGYVEFNFAGQSARLQPLIEGDQLFFIFRDETRQRETYGAGRFLYTAMPDHGLSQPGSVTLDFNQAHNPPCAYTPYATCPLPPVSNRLAFRIPAGEQRFND